MKKPVLQIQRMLLQLGFYFIETTSCDDCDMPIVAQPLHELPEQRKMDHRLLSGCAENKMASVDSSRNYCATIGLLQLLQHDVPKDFA
jgi:hypothetical protein